jgi:two-component system, NarL family, response regulator NreC
VRVTTSVLLVDDHALMRAGIRRLLEREGDFVVVGESGSAEDAVVKARAHQPGLVLLDLVLPRRGGAEAIADIHKVSPDSKVLIVSSQASPSAVRAALTAGASGYVPKRAAETELVTAIRAVIAGRGYVDPDLGAKLVVPVDEPGVSPLSERERDVLYFLALGLTNQEIGKRLFISVRTVDTHRAHIMQKLRLNTRAELVLFALAHGVIGAA